MTTPPAISVVIPNWNGEKYLRLCLTALSRQTRSDFEILVVDNGSSDGSLALLARDYPAVRCLRNAVNTGFAAAANQGLAAAAGVYVALLNNDTEPAPDWLEQLACCLDRHPDACAAGASLLRYDRRDRLEDAGGGYTILGIAFRYGEDEVESAWPRQDAEVFTVCAGAALYRRERVQALGGFAEPFFAYVEDLDLGWRARRAGYSNWSCPAARVWHVGSASSGSRYNPWKVQLTTRNNLWTLRRNLPAPLLALSLPALLAGTLLKTVFYARQGRDLWPAQWRGLCAGLRAPPPLPPLPQRSWRRDLALWAGFWGMTATWLGSLWRRLCRRRETTA